MVTEGFRTAAAVWNRESILELLARELERAAHERRGVSVLLVGIDQLQHLSSQRGESYAESVLVEVAKRLTALLRSYDHVGRYAAEQLLVLPLSQDAGGIASLAQNFCHAIARDPIELPGEHVRLTVTIAAATVSDGQAGHFQLLRQLEIALYRAHAAGGNRVEMVGIAATPARPPIPSRDEVPVRLLVTVGLLVGLAILLLISPGSSCAPFRVADILSSEELPPPLPVDCAATAEKPSDGLLQGLDKQRETRGLLLQETVTCKLSLSSRSRATRVRDQQWLSSLYVNGAYQYRQHVFLAGSEDVPGGRLYTVQVCLLPWWTYLTQPADACWGRYAFWR